MATTQTKPLGKVDKTERGFEIIRFQDANEVECSLQQSSAILGDLDAAMNKPGSSGLWLGCQDPNPRLLHGVATKLGIKHEATCGWVPYPLPDDVLCNTRMHLTREQVEQLIPHLQAWLKSGSLKA